LAERESAAGRVYNGTSHVLKSSKPKCFQHVAINNGISGNALFKGDFEGAPSAIKAKTIILPAELDRYFPPVDAE
jgi:hypothetical protein